MLLQLGSRWAVAPAGQPFKPEGETWLDTAAMDVRVDPPAEWRQMYREVWRIERDFLYDPNAHGLDLRAAEKRYEHLVTVASRGDLNYLFSEMLGNLVLGHTYVGGGDGAGDPVPGGLLGADYETADGRASASPTSTAAKTGIPGCAPAPDAAGRGRSGRRIPPRGGRRDVRADDNVHRFFENTAGKAVRIKVGTQQTGTAPAKSSWNRWRTRRPCGTGHGSTATAAG